MAIKRGFHMAMTIFLAFIIIAGSHFETFSAEQTGKAKLRDKNRNLSPVDLASNRTKFILAASQNSSLKKALNWTFGGKPQLGWYIYIPLIDHTIGTDKEAESPEFAIALSQWQKSEGIAPTGVLDENSWNRMVRDWQTCLSKERIVPKPDQMVFISRSYLYDTARPDELRKAEPEAYAAYRRMVAAALADPLLKLTKTKNGDIAPTEKFLKVVSAYRPQSYQDSLLKKNPDSSAVSLAKISPHLTGQALDLYIGGEPTSAKDENRALQTQTPAYKWLVQNAAKFGFVPYFYEPWHWEYKHSQCL